MQTCVKLWNDNVSEKNGGKGNFDFMQEFRGEKLHIPAGKYIEMEYDDAVSFRGMFYPPRYDAMGNQRADSYKMLRIEGSPPEDKSQSTHLCRACGDKFLTAEELEHHIDKNHLDQLTDQDLASKRRSKSSGGKGE